jgi:hypothetical protein
LASERITEVQNILGCTFKSSPITRIVIHLHHPIFQPPHIPHLKPK